MFTVICQVVQETVLFFDLRLLLFAFFLLRTFQLFLHRSVFFHHHSVSKILWRSYSEDPIPIFFGKVKAILEPTFWAVFLVFQTSCCPKPTFAINVNLTTLPQPFSNIALPCVRLPPSLCSQGFISSFMITCSGTDIFTLANVMVVSILSGCVCYFSRDSGTDLFTLASVTVVSILSSCVSYFGVGSWRICIFVMESLTVVSITNGVICDDAATLKVEKVHDFESLSVKWLVHYFKI